MLKTLDHVHYCPLFSVTGSCPLRSVVLSHWIMSSIVPCSQSSDHYLYWQLFSVIGSWPLLSHVLSNSLQSCLCISLLKLCLYDTAVLRDPVTVHLDFAYQYFQNKTSMSHHVTKSRQTIFLVPSPHRLCLQTCLFDLFFWQVHSLHPIINITSQKASIQLPSFPFK